MTSSAERTKFSLEERVAYVELVGGLSIPDKYMQDESIRSKLLVMLDSTDAPVFEDQVTVEGRQAIADWLLVRPTDGKTIEYDADEEDMEHE